MIEALVARFPGAGARLECGAAAVTVEGPRAESAPGRRWTVRTADGRAFDADVLVSTLPAPASLAAYSSFEAWLIANPV